MIPLFARPLPKHREEVIAQTFWRSVAPSLTELKTLDFAVLTGQIAAQAESTGDQIYQRL